ncbi:uncharacterized protein J4E87_000432 [Alternaria ethzedia]|uniref:uncharacterized protein n=1 Tax=Alternaria ethzedia TaxID=181014 RepID=UPI0020C4C1D0|nr:uncharacterized protein J4E87_000432 [Alternaria ethzedia]KAI4635480.1 hypothetical protein J4E87_000432 [Alternaria ethzedia]
MVKKVALITGGASGMGLAVAEALAARTNEEWDLHLVDLSADNLTKATSSLKNGHAHQANVADYASLVAAFESAWSKSGRLDFVFANAGIAEKDNFYQEHALDAPPPPPNSLVIDVNYTAVINTSWLAFHYFRKSQAKHGRENNDAALVMTASCGGLYPAEFGPMYSGAKAGVIHFNRAITVAYHHAGIRTFTVCPSIVRTGLLSEEEWGSLPESFMTPMDTVVNAVVKVMDGGDIEDANGRKVAGKDNWGLTVELFGKNFYFRDGVEYCDEAMRTMATSTGMKAQLERIGKPKAEGEHGAPILNDKTSVPAFYATNSDNSACGLSRFSAGSIGIDLCDGCPVGPPAPDILVSNAFILRWYRKKNHPTVTNATIANAAPNATPVIAPPESVLLSLSAITLDTGDKLVDEETDMEVVVKLVVDAMSDVDD